MQQSIAVLKRSQNAIPVINSRAGSVSYNIFSRFMNWCGLQEKNRMLWLGLSYLGIIGMALPCAVFAVLYLGGNNFNLIATTAIVNVPVLALNLAAQGTKVTLPVFFFTLVVDIAIILYSVAFFLFQ